MAVYNNFQAAGAAWFEKTGARKPAPSMDGVLAKFPLFGLRNSDALGALHALVAPSSTSIGKAVVAALQGAWVSGMVADSAPGKGQGRTSAPSDANSPSPYLRLFTGSPGTGKTTAMQQAKATLALHLQFARAADRAVVVSPALSNARSALADLLGKTEGLASRFPSFVSFDSEAPAIRLHVRRADEPKEPPMPAQSGSTRGNVVNRSTSK